jgi:D-alanyl-D-alanine carboxypeptidase
VTGPGRLGAHAAAAIVGAIVGAVLVLAADGLTRTPAAGPRAGPVTSPSPPAPAVGLQRQPRSVSVSARPRGTLLAWAPGGLPPGIEGLVERVPKVKKATLVRAGLDWIHKTRAADGHVVDAPKALRAIPFEVAVVSPREYARFVPPSERAAITALKRNRLLLADTAAELRHGSVGMTIKLEGRTARVAGTISDVAANGYEAIMRPPVPRSWARVDEFLLVKNGGARRERIENVIRAHLSAGQRLQVRVNDEQPFLRYGDAVHPQMIIKKEFGEFSAIPQPDGHIAIDPRWVEANIRTGAVPVLGHVTCHRALFPQLRRALRSIKSAGLSHLVDPTSFGGCFGPRFINSDPDGRLSHHAWGIAFDINVAQNRYGAEPNMPRRIVDLIEDEGFTWGGRWIIPDGMHFEWQSWAPR